MGFDAQRPSVELRPVNEQDKEFLEELYASTRAHETALFGWDQQQIRAFVRSQFAAQSVHYKQHFPTATEQIIVLAGSDAGRLCVQRDEEIRLIDISLLPGARGQGVGSMLIRELIVEAQGAGSAIVLHVERSSRALGLYQRLGFEIDEDLGAHLRLRHPATR